MNTVVQLPDRALMLEQASEWVAKMVSGNMSEADREALEQWLSESPLYSEALLECADAWDELDELAELAEMFPRTPPQQVVTETSSVSSWHLSSELRWAAMAATVVFAALLLLFYPQNNQNLDAVRQAITAVGEYKTAVLPDGSKATLNTDSQVEAVFDADDSIRKVTLIKGEAHFDVQHDPSRPFVVEVGNTRVTAIGTAFNIDASSGELEVTVTEGVVEISVSGAISASEPAVLEHSQRLEAGHIAIIADNQIELVEAVENSEIERKLSWQQGKIQFIGEPLSQVVREISRYTHYDFQFADAQAGDIRVGGYFQIGNIDEMLDVLSSSFDIEVIKNDAGVIHLASRQKNNH